MKQTDFDVIVVGGGMVGATAACALAQGGVKVALVDKYQPAFEWAPDTVDVRVSAITKASEAIFRHLGTWPLMQKYGICAYRDMRVWDGQGSGELHFDCADTVFNELGHIIENRVTVAALWQILAQLPSATCITGSEVADMQPIENGKRLILQNGRGLNAHLIIAADGRDSPLRKLVGIGVTGWPYQQDGLVATVTTEKGHQHTAWQRFLPAGPLAFLPLRTGQCSIVWTLASDTAKQYVGLEEAEFLAKLEQASHGILGKMLACVDRASFSLRFQYANQYTSDYFALIGDAAHAMHPLAGQGANSGLLDAAAIAELVIEAKQQQRPFNSHKLLRRYERWRKGDNLLMMSSMDVLNKTFALTAPPLVGLRSLGMNCVNQTQFLKNYFNHHALGLRTDLPQTAQIKV